MTRSRITTFVIGCVQSSEVALQSLLSRSDIDVRGVLTVRKSAFNSDFVDLSGIALTSGVPVYFAEETDEQALTKILRQNEVDIAFAIGWSRLITEDILSIPKHGVVGFHPAALPKNRGRHPLIWALALGLEKTASTLFLIDKYVDSGPILNQLEIKISLTDDAQSLYNKVLAVLPSQIDSIIDDLLVGKLNAVQQDHSLANNWRKRGPLDGLIDWRMSAQSVYNLTRALSHPYVGAEFRYGYDIVKLWRCEIVSDDIPNNVEPGKILNVDKRGAVVKTGFGAEGGAVRLLESEICPDLKKGDYM